MFARLYPDPVNAVTWVLVGLAVFAMAEAALWFVVLPWARRRSAAREVAGAAEVAADPQRYGPARASYRACTWGYSQVCGNGQLMITADRLRFRRVGGKYVDVPLADITGLDEAVRWRGEWRDGRTHLIVKTTTGDLGYFVDDIPRWRAAITAAAPRLLHPSHVRRSFRKVMEAAALDPGARTPRELRHSLVSLLSYAGVPIEHISAGRP